MIILGTNSIKDTGYDVDYSCRFDNAYSGTGASDYLTRTYSAGNRRTFTISFWIKRSGLFVSQWQQVLGQYDAGADQLFRVGYNSGEQGDIIRCYGAPGGFEFRTTALYRDVSAWYHVVLAIDTTQSTEANRAKLYVNGTQVTSFVTANYPSQNVELHYNEGKAHSIGRAAGSGNQGLPAYLAQLISIDGTAYAASDFGEFDEDSPTIWKPKDVSGLTFGSQGFYLDFADAADLGDDESGNGNDWTETGIAAINQVTDTPTNNFATLNPLVPSQGGFTPGSPTFAEGNLKFTTANASSSYSRANSTILLTTGKWYTEIKYVNSGSIFGLVGITGSNPTAVSAYLGVYAYDYGWYGNGGFSSGDGNFYNNNGIVRELGAGFDNNDILGMAIDLDSGTKTIQYYRAGSAVGSANAIADPSATDFGGYVVCASEWSNSSNATFEFNFGNPAFTVSSGNADGDGYGNFEYAPPSGYFALCTKNLAEYG